MSVFKRSSEEKGHSHIIYFCEEPNEEGFYGRTSTIDGHYHDVIRVEEEDEQGNVSYEYILSTISNHTHDIEGFEELRDEELQWSYPKDGKEVEADQEYVYDDEEAVVRDFAKAYTSYREEEERSNFIKYGKDSESLHFGGEKTWEIDDLKAIKAERKRQAKSSLTFNFPRVLLNNLLGTLISSNKMPVVYCREQDDEQLAEYLNELLTHQWDYNNGGDILRKVMRDALVAGRGVYFVHDPRVSGRDKDSFKIKIESPAWDSVCFAPYTKDDLSDCEGVAYYRWIKEKDMALYVADRKKREEIKELGAKSFTNIPGVSDRKNMFNYMYNVEEKKIAYVVMQRYVVANRRYFRNKKHHILYNGEDGTLDTSRLSAKRFNEIKTIEGYDLEVINDEPSRELWQAEFMGNILVDYKRILGNTFSFIPVIPERNKIGDCYYINNQGIQLKDIAITYNLSMSEIKGMYARGIHGQLMLGEGFFQEGTTEIDQDDILSKANKGNAFIKGLGDIGQARELSGASVSPQAFQFTEALNRMLTQVSGVTPEMQGYGGNNSSLLHRQKSEQALGSHAHILTASQKALREVARKMVDHIKYNLSNAEDAYKKLQAQNYINRTEGLPELELGSLDDFRIVWGRLQEASFDVSFGSRNMSKTERQTSYESMVELAKQYGGAFPPELLIEANPDTPSSVKMKLINHILQTKQLEQQNQQIMQQQNAQAMINQQQIAAQAGIEKQRMGDELKKHIADQKAELEVLKLELEALKKDGK